MPNWAWGTFRVKGKKEAMLAFSRHLIMEDAPRTIEGVRYFARTFTGDTRRSIEGQIRDMFAGKGPQAEMTCEILADFAWSAYSCVVDGYPQDNPERCITLADACREDGVDVRITTKEPGIYFEEQITCDRRGNLVNVCQDLIPMRCRRCGNVEGRASFEDPDDLCCSECGESDFAPAEEEDEWH